MKDNESHPEHASDYDETEEPSELQKLVLRTYALEEEIANLWQKLSDLGL